MGAWSTGLLLTATGVAGVRIAHADECDFETPGFTRPELTNACIEPQSGIELTLAAVVDTVVPGPDIDPRGDPGALEACAINMLLDGYYPFRENASMLAGLMDMLSNLDFGQPFIDLAHDDRLVILVKAQNSVPLLRLAYRAIRSAFFGGAYNGVGLDYLGYPGPNLGYRHIPEASFRRPMCREATETGWMP